MTLPLYSTGTQSKAECKFDNGIEAISAPEERKCTCAEERESWSYMFIHHRKVDMVSRILEKKHFPVFVHKSVVCKRDDKSPQKVKDKLFRVCFSCKAMRRRYKNF